MNLILPRGGAKQIGSGAAVAQTFKKQGSFKPSPSNRAQSITSSNSKHSRHFEANSPFNNASLLRTNEIEPSRSYDVVPVNDLKNETRPQSSDIFEKAQAAITSAERASAAARAAAALVHIKLPLLQLEEGKSS
ncbi:IST1-like isoform X1 [Quillaja saponaria]|uniref:IST1-like isoform X1 n=1 Tax=Quillaja saponaria TaxID=32244 RepID=A0AAD7PGJ9_QUISA|nr:IST1-like isoform X1 [Quillaja saponaria]